MVQSIVLIGPMGAGKSTIGRQLASRLGFEFLDTDHIIEDRTGADIPWIFDVEGEEGFRARESAVLADVINDTGVVIATGGGIVTQQENRELLETHANVVYLTASIEQLVERTFKDKKRPLLQVEDPRTRIVELFETRDPLYKSVANHIVVTDRCSAKAVVQKVTNILDLS